MTTDVVCILDSTLAQVLATARPIKATVREEAKTMEHPLETGASVIDHRIILPVCIELQLVLTGEEYRQTYQAARELFYRGELLTVQTRTGSYPSMMIAALPHEESPDVADAVIVGITLAEVRFITASFTATNVRNKADGKTVRRGGQQPKEATSPKKASILSGLFR